MKQRVWLSVPLVIFLGYLAIIPAPLYGLFGFGDIVFDPSSYAAIGEIWQQDITNGAKLIQTYNQTVKMVKNGLDIYNLATAMAQRVQNKSLWKMSGFSVGNEIAQQHYNESINFATIMNGDALDAGTAWTGSTRYAGNAGYLGTMTAANSRRMSEFATIQLLDATSQRCATILANYKATQDANQGASDQLDADTLDQTDLKNSMVAVLNIMSGGQIHMRTQTQANGNLQACEAEQNTLAAKVQRDKLSNEQMWYADVAQARASTPATIDPNDTATTSTTYLEP